jgi:hypothetical protein
MQDLDVDNYMQQNPSEGNSYSACQEIHVT